MAGQEESILLIVVVAVVAVIGLGIAASSFATDQSFGRMMRGGMMGNVTADTGPGGTEWAVLVSSAVFFVAAMVLWYRSRRPIAIAPSAARPMPDAARIDVYPAPAPIAVPELAVPEPALMKLLDEDERRMYLEIRDHGGTMYQRDLVALGTFSKAKVTRVLDKLETKGLIVRERHGMTNRVRLVQRAGK